MDEEVVGAAALEAARGEFDGETVGAWDGDTEESTEPERGGDVTGDGLVFGGDFLVGGFAAANWAWWGGGLAAEGTVVEGSGGGRASGAGFASRSHRGLEQICRSLN